MYDSRRQEINVRLDIDIDETLCSLGHGGIIKLLDALNLPPPIQEQRYSETQKFILSRILKAQDESMVVTIEEAAVESGDMRELTVSGDDTWLMRGHSSMHVIAALCSTTEHPKVLDTIWLPKKNVLNVRE